ncbi:PQQ-dependent sugar dehydrogenase [Novosphingobium lentum]|uniref:PQQ-dependent sugar dehydrogenase n=1 Tax=Novosphingobium lentum TaxID=145287 RepID=UPI00082EB527|nr:sorbosone dehydrogenase family protein [Novosphingobium lentum]
MTKLRKTLLSIFVAIIAFVAIMAFLLRGDAAQQTLAETSGPKPVLVDPDAQTIPTVGTADPIGWQAGEAPVAAQGLTVTRFADGLEHPRTILTLPNGDVLAAETNGPASGASGITGMVEKYLMKKVGAGGVSPNKLVLLRDANGDGVAEQRFVLSNPALHSPFGMAWRDGRLYVANTDAVLSFPYALGDTTLSGTPEKLMDLPGAGRHWARNLLLNPEGTLLYVTIGSGTDHAENGIEQEKGRAAIFEYDFAKKRSREYAAGLRNPNGLDWNPNSGELWTTVNERDMLGSDLVPDYLTNVPSGVQYGWPWVYWKNHLDDRVSAPIPEFFTEYTRKPEYGLGAHVAALGLAFSRGGNVMGPRFASGAFIARHGSWNRRPLSGYDVVFVGFDHLGNALPAPPVPVLTGFLTKDGAAHGRPTWVGFARDGALLVSDDVGGVIWRVVAPGAVPAPSIVPTKSDRAPVQPKLHGTIAAPAPDSDLLKGQQ